MHLNILLQVPALLLLVVRTRNALMLRKEEWTCWKETMGRGSPTSSVSSLAGFCVAELTMS